MTGTCDELKSGSLSLFVVECNLKQSLRLSASSTSSKDYGRRTTIFLLLVRHIDFKLYIIEPTTTPRALPIDKVVSMASKLANATRYKLIFNVPPAALATCKAAIFAAGAGRYPGKGNYTECAFVSMGTGQFRPGDSANPNIGTVGKLEEVQEARVETLCVGEEVVKAAVAALKTLGLPTKAYYCQLTAEQQSPSLRGASL
jgi:hypothetical protein